jgi:hypothetical protein
LGKIIEERGKEEILEGRGKKEEIGGQRLFWETFIGALLFLVTLGLKVRKPQGFLEVGSQRGCSYLVGR